MKHYSWYYYYWNTGRTQYICRLENKVDDLEKEDFHYVHKAEIAFIPDLSLKNSYKKIPAKVVEGYKQAHKLLQKYLPIL